MHSVGPHVNRQLVTAYLSLILSCKFICHGMTIILREDTCTPSCIGVKNFSGSQNCETTRSENVCDAPFFNRMNQGIYGAKPLAESTKFRSSPHRPGSIQRANHHCHNSYPPYKKNPGNISMPRSTATSLAFTAFLLSDLTLPSRGFAPSGVTFIAKKNKRSFRSSSLSMVFGFGQTRSGGEGGGGGKRKRPDQPHASSFSARSSVVRNSADSESTRAKIDTSNFGVSNANVDTVRDTFRDDVYQNSLHRLLCDGEEECLF